MKVVSVNISREKGTIKTPAKFIEVNESGIVSDAHAGDWHRQVSLLAIESIDKFAKKTGEKYQYGEFAENITTEGIDLIATTPGDKLKIGKVLLEVTQIGKECHGDACAIFLKAGKCVMPKEGIFCKVLAGGRISPNDEIVYLKQA